MFLFKKWNVNIMCVGDTILDDEAEAGIDENCCLIDNKLKTNDFINGKYILKIKDDTDVQYLRVH